MSSRFRISDVPGDPASIEKRGEPAAIDRETDALGLLAGRSWAPRLVDHGPGWMLSERLPGAPRPIATVGRRNARSLGNLVREAHEVRRASTGGLWSWREPALSLADYRSRRVEDTERLLAGGPDEGLARRGLARGNPTDGGETAPFRMLHGDLVEANVVWGPAGPALVDWEFWRMGDPAEDLAYLIETNALPEAVSGPLLEGYACAGMAARVEEWRPLVAADAGAWYASEGLRVEAAVLLARARSLV